MPLTGGVKTRRQGWGELAQKEGSGVESEEREGEELPTKERKLESSWAQTVRLSEPQLLHLYGGDNSSSSMP